MSFSSFSINPSKKARVARQEFADSSSDDEGSLKGPSGLPKSLTCEQLQVRRPHSAAAIAAFAGPTLRARLQEAGYEAAAAGRWSQALRNWDAALASSPPTAFKLHEAKAQVAAAACSSAHASTLPRRCSRVCNRAAAVVTFPACLQVWMEVGEDWRAVQCAQRAVELQPGWAAGHLTLCRAQLNLGEPELALQSCERVLQIQPDHAEAAAELTGLRTLVLQRRQSGDAAAGQRVHVLRDAGQDGGGCD